jgi:hypothetical protein
MCLRRSLLLLAAAAPAVGAQSRATLVGSVRDSTGAAVAFAQLTAGVMRALSDSAGRFVVTGLPAGTTAIIARRLGFHPDTATIELADGRTDSLHIVLFVLPAQLPGLVAVRKGMTSVSRISIGIASPGTGTTSAASSSIRCA